VGAEQITSCSCSAVRHLITSPALLFRSYNPSANKASRRTKPLFLLDLARYSNLSNSENKVSRVPLLTLRVSILLFWTGFSSCRKWFTPWTVREDPKFQFFLFVQRRYVFMVWKMFTMDWIVFPWRELVTDTGVCDIAETGRMSFWIDGHLSMYTSSVAISNPGLLSSSETGIILGIRSWKQHLSEWAWCQKAIGGIYSTKKWRSETL
jgi:hypothetical protein